VALAALTEASFDARYAAGDHRGIEILINMTKKLRECRTASAFKDRKCGAYYVRPNSCGVRLCPDCERARSGRLVARYGDVADDMADPRFLTLTIPNVALGELLEMGIPVLIDAQAHFRRQAIFAGGPCPNAHRAVAYTDLDTGKRYPADKSVARCDHPRHKRDLAAAGACRCARCLRVRVHSDGYQVELEGCPRCIHRGVAGGVYSIEISFNEAGSWHPHTHLLLDTPWLVHSEIRDAWRACTCDAIRRAERRRDGLAGRVPTCAHSADARGLSVGGCRGGSIVWIEPVVGDPGSAEFRKAVRETLKYTTKGLLDRDGRTMPGLRSADVGELLLAMRNRRLVAGWGTFRDVKDADDDDELDPEAFLVGDDVPVELRGLPVHCPSCNATADWLWRIQIPRIAARSIGDGRWAYWDPPGLLN
jgi:hypothetical protein